jgi:hypothetical protein
MVAKTLLLAMSYRIGVNKKGPALGRAAELP